MAKRLERLFEEKRKDHFLDRKGNHYVVIPKLPAGIYIAVTDKKLITEVQNPIYFELDFDCNNPVLIPFKKNLVRVTPLMKYAKKIKTDPKMDLDRRYGFELSPEKSRELIDLDLKKLKQLNPVIHESKEIDMDTKDCFVKFLKKVSAPYYSFNSFLRLWNEDYYDSYEDRLYFCGEFRLFKEGIGKQHGNKR